VDFAGRVTDISCSVALNGGNNAGSGSVWLAPVSLAEVHDRGAGAFMKPQPFTLELSNCQLRHDGGAADKDEIRLVNVRWVDGFTVNAVGNENAGYLRNTRADGASHIFLALSTNDNNTLDKSNKIPGRPLAKPGAAGRKSGRWRRIYLLHRLRDPRAGKSNQRPVDQLGNMGARL
jgi:type 1 fimbria pilin